MENEDLIKLKIKAEINNVKDEKIKDLMKHFISEENFLLDPNKSFINACIKNNCTGNSPIIIAKRFKAQTIINNILNSLYIKSNIDFIDGELLKDG